MYCCKSLTIASIKIISWLAKLVGASVPSIKGRSVCAASAVTTRSVSAVSIAALWVSLFATLLVVKTAAVAAE